ncbi:hypothetical protein ACJMK2_035812, partial [Sinanodonta woodiana]
MANPYHTSQNKTRQVRKEKPRRDRQASTRLDNLVSSRQVETRQYNIVQYRTREVKT